jgi:hypothetical protein
VKGLAQQHAILDSTLEEVERSAGTEEQNPCFSGTRIAANLVVDLGAIQVREPYVKEYEIR